MRTLQLVALVSLLVSGCDAPAQARKDHQTIRDTRPPADPDWSSAFDQIAADPSARRAIHAPSYADARAKGPDPGDSPSEERKRAVLDLLSGGKTEHLPLEDLEPGDKFDPGLGMSLELGAIRHVVVGVRLGAPKVTGSFPEEVIQRIVRQNIGRLRLCYENGLRADPTLKGAVTVHFTIDKQGLASALGILSTSVPDHNVVACVQKTFSAFSFPSPDKPPIDVAYPVTFTPDSASDPENPFGSK